ncbi:MAG: hypothetical protein ACXVBD_03645 [Pseudobdellovibrio sp.]
MTTKFYSPVFNTALFDGPIRVYFSQSYETSALKIYHLLQTQYSEIWNQLKNHTLATRKHLFLMIYPEPKDLQIVFDQSKNFAHTQEWEEGLAVGFSNSQNDADLKAQMEYLVSSISNWVIQSKNNEISH